MSKRGSQSRTNSHRSMMMFLTSTRKNLKSWKSSLKMAGMDLKLVKIILQFQRTCLLMLAELLGLDPSWVESKHRLTSSNKRQNSFTRTSSKMQRPCTLNQLKNLTKSTRKEYSASGRMRTPIKLSSSYKRIS